MPDAPVLPMLPAKNEWNYRNNMQFMVNGQGRLCLRAPDSHTPVPIEVCYIMDERIGEMFKTLELDPESFDGVTFRVGQSTGEKFIILESEDPETPEIETDEPVSIAFRGGDITVPIWEKRTLRKKLVNARFKFRPTRFFRSIRRWRRCW